MSTSPWTARWSRPPGSYLSGLGGFEGESQLHIPLYLMWPARRPTSDRTVSSTHTCRRSCLSIFSLDTEHLKARAEAFQAYLNDVLAINFAENLHVLLRFLGVRVGWCNSSSLRTVRLDLTMLPPHLGLLQFTLRQFGGLPTAEEVQKATELALRELALDQDARSSPAAEQSGRPSPTRTSSRAGDVKAQPSPSGPNGA